MRILVFVFLGSAALMAQLSGRPDCVVDGTTVNAITGEPLTRVRVTVVGTGWRVSGVTNSSGKWGFANVNCSPLEVITDRQGFLPGRYAGAPAHDLKISLMPHAVISGKVMDDQGEPVTNTQIYTVTFDVIAGKRTPLPGPFTNTNDLGEYRLANLPAGRYIVCARASGALPPPSGMQTIYGDKCYPGPVGQAGPALITAGSLTRMDFTLEQVPAVHVRGIVSGLPQGTGVGVSLVRRGASQSFVSDRGTSTKTDGSFDIAGIAPGSYLLVANVTRTAGHLTAHLPLEVGPSGAEGVALSLERTPTVKVSIRIDSAAGTELPQEHPRLALRSSEQAISSRLVECHDDLTCSVADVSPGDYRLGILSVPAPFYVSSATAGGQDILGREFYVSAAAAPIEVVLRDDGGAIEGDVLNPDGQPVSGNVMAVRGGTAVTRVVKSHFKLENLAPGDYRVYAWDDATQVEYADPEWMRRNGGSGVAVTVAPGQSAQVKLSLQAVPRP